MENPNNYIKIESLLNREGNQLPFAYFSPKSDGKVTWHCNVDPNNENKIISVFCFAGDTENSRDRNITELKSIEEAINTRDTLIQDGWQKLKPPQVNITYEDGRQQPLNRQQKRYLKSLGKDGE